MEEDTFLAFLNLMERSNVINNFIMDMINLRLGKKMDLRKMEEMEMSHIKRFLCLKENFIQVFKQLKVDKYFGEFFGTENIYDNIISMIGDQLHEIKEFEEMTRFVPEKTFDIQSAINLYFSRKLEKVTF